MMCESVTADGMRYPMSDECGGSDGSSARLAGAVPARSNHGAIVITPALKHRLSNGFEKFVNISLTTIGLYLCIVG